MNALTFSLIEWQNYPGVASRLIYNSGCNATPLMLSGKSLQVLSVLGSTHSSNSHR